MKRTKFKLGQKVIANVPVAVKSVDTENFTLEAVFSTQDIDRHGDVVMQDGWDLGPFKKAPVILDSHNYDSVTEVIGKASNVKIDGKALSGKIKFAVNENPKARIIFDLYAGGYVNSFSVGFIVKAFGTKKDGTTDYYVIAEAELLEVSAVSVPANAKARAKAAGIDTDALDDADNEPDQDDDADEEPADGDGEGNGDAPADDGGEGAGGDEPQAEEGDGDAEPEAEETEPPKPAAGAGEEPAAREPEPEPPVTAPKSYMTKAAEALGRIDAERRENLARAKSVIDRLLAEKGIPLPESDAEKARRRKVNQAIRALLKTK